MSEEFTLGQLSNTINGIDEDWNNLISILWEECPEEMTEIANNQLGESNDTER